MEFLSWTTTADQTLFPRLSFNFSCWGRVIRQRIWGRFFMSLWDRVIYRDSEAVAKKFFEAESLRPSLSCIVSETVSLSITLKGTLWNSLCCRESDPESQNNRLWCRASETETLMQYLRWSLQSSVHSFGHGIHAKDKDTLGAPAWTNYRTEPRANCKVRQTLTEQSK